MRKRILGTIGLCIVYNLTVSTIEGASFKTEKAEYVSPSPQFAQGVKGKCLKGVRGKNAENLFFIANTPQRFIAIPNSPLPVLNDQSGTISLWIKNTASYIWYSNILGIGKRGRSRLGIGLNPTDNKGAEDADPSHYKNGRISIRVSDEEGKTAGLSSPKISIDSSWHHIAVTWNNEKIIFYFDGKNAGSRNNPPLPDLNYPGYFYIASDVRRRGRFSGDVDEVMFFSQPLSPDEISGLVKREDFSKHKDLVFYLPFDGNLNYKVKRHSVSPPKKITITFPEVGDAPQGSSTRKGERYGYFPIGMKIPIKVRIPFVSGLTGKYKVNFSLIDVDNKELFAEEKTLIALPRKDVTTTLNISPEKCGIYWLKVSLKDGKGKVIKEKELPFAVIVKLPSISSVSSDSPLGGAPLVGDFMPQGRAVGMKWDRFWTYEVNWCAIEQEPGKFSWEATDKLVDEAIKSGTEVLFTIHGTPDWASSAPDDKELYKYDYLVTRYNGSVPLWQVGKLRRFFPSKDMKYWDRFVRKLVKRYKKKVRYWEILNEPNAWPYFMCKGNRAEAYVQLLKVAYKAIHEEDPKAKVAGCDGCPGFLLWTEEVLEKGGGPYFDILSVHNYNNDSPIKWARQRLIEKTDKVVFKHLGKHVPIWNTEAGFPQPGRVRGRPMSEKEFLKKFGEKKTRFSSVTMVPEHRSACWEIQAHFLDFASGVEKIFLHCGSGVSILYGDGGKASYLPTEKGVAYAAMSKVVANRKSIKKIDLGTSEAAGVIVKDRKGKNTAVLFAEGETSVCFLVKDNRVFKGMDFLGNPLKWRSENNLLSVKIGMEPVYIFNVPPDLGGTEILKVKVEDVPQGSSIRQGAESTIRPDSPSKGELTVTNPFSSSLTGKLDISLPVDWKISLPKDISLSPGEKKVIPFTLIARNAPRGEYTVQFQLKKGGNVIARQEQKYFCQGIFKQVYEAKKPIKVDGNISDWEGIRAEKVDTIKKVLIGLPNPMFPKGFPHWEGADDLSYRVKTTWKFDDSLYLLIEVVDNKLEIVPADKETLAWKWDCIEIFFDGRSLEEQKVNELTAGAEQFFVIPSLTKTPSRCKVMFIKGNPAISAEFIGKRTKDGYLIEGKIKPKKESSFCLVPGTKFGLDVAIDDADKSSSSGSRKTQMVWYGTEENFFKNTSKWGRFMLLFGKE